jgi:hypothetical protein
LNKLFRLGIVLFLIGSFTVLSPRNAFAEEAWTTIICANAENVQREFNVGWDNTNQYFSDKGEIPRLYCEGGFAGQYTVYISDGLEPDSPLRWYYGIAPTPEPTVEPTPTPTITPEVTQTPEPTPIPSQIDVVPVPEVPVPSESPSESVTEPPAPIEEPVVEPEPEVITLEPEIVEPEPEPEPVVEPEVVQEVVQEEPTAEEVTQEVIDDALADGVLTDEERELVADALIEEFAGEAITFEALEESGLDYEDLPPEQPVMLENGVVLTAEVADAIEIFDNTNELLNVLFTDPGKALKAVSNIGVDMTPESRETSQNVVVSAVIVGQLAQIRRVK